MNASTTSSGTIPTNGAKPAEPATIRFRLKGPSRPFDPATSAIRSDLADLAEAEFHFAPHYVLPAAWHVQAECSLRAKPKPDADIRAELAAGSGFALLDITGDWAWGYADDTHIVGYVPADCIAPAAG